MREEGEKKEYEIAFLVEDEAAVPSVLTILKEHGAEVGFEGPCRRISLPYEIAGRPHASFGYCHFATAPPRVGELEKALRLHAGVLRVLISTPPFKKGAQRGARQKEEAVALTTSEPSAPRKHEPLPLSNEELEKKIGEILQ